MKSFFSAENPIIVFINTVADLIMLNLIFLITCLPVITIGASLTSLNYVTVKMIRKEESYVWKDYFKSFKQNFKQATVIWIVNMLVIGGFVLNAINNMINPDLVPTPVIILTVVLMLVAVSVMVYVYPLLSHFENTIGQTVKNAALLAIIHLPRTLLFIFLTAIPVVFVAAYSRTMKALPLLFILGFSVPAYIGSMEWDRIFKTLEPSEEDEEIGN